MELAALQSQQASLSSSISHYGARLAELKEKKRRLMEAKKKFAKDVIEIEESNRLFQALEVHEDGWKGDRATAFKTTYEQKVLSSLKTFIGRLGEVDGKISEAIQKIESEIATCEASIAAAQSSLAVVKSDIKSAQLEKENR